MADEIPINTTVRKIDWRSLVEDVEGHEFHDPFHIAYEFTSKTFRETDENGVYEP